MLWMMFGLLSLL